MLTIHAGRVARGEEARLYHTTEGVVRLCKKLGLKYALELDRDPQRLAQLLEEAAAKI